MNPETNPNPMPEDLVTRWDIVRGLAGVAIATAFSMLKRHRIDPPPRESDHYRLVREPSPENVFRYSVLQLPFDSEGRYMDNEGN